MIDELRLKLMKRKPTLDDIVKSDVSKDVKIVFRVAMRRAEKDQKKISKKATGL